MSSRHSCTRDSSARSAADGGRTTGEVGRPRALLTLDPTSGAAVGIDVDHDCLRVVVADRSHTVLAEAERPLEIDHDADTAMALAADLMHLVVDEAAWTRRRSSASGWRWPVRWIARPAVRTLRASRRAGWASTPRQRCGATSGTSSTSTTTRTSARSPSRCGARGAAPARPRT